MHTQTVRQIFEDSVSLKAKLAQDESFCNCVSQAADKMLETLRCGGTLYSCGNGGSACDAEHLTQEIVGHFKRNRPGLRALTFGGLGTITCLANDYEYAEIYSRQVDALCTKQDLLILFSTSGNSENIIRAAAAAKRKKTFVVAFTGRNGGKLAPIVDLPIIVPAQLTERIQEVHITLIHIFLEIIERELFPEAA